MMKEFPIPLRVIGPGSQSEEEELIYMHMPQGMSTFDAPLLPEQEDLVARNDAKIVLRAVLVALEAVMADGVNRSISLDHLNAQDRQLVNTVLGEGEVSALAAWEDEGSALNIQESVFAGVWRVIQAVNGNVISDAIEIGSVPRVLEDIAAQDVRAQMPIWSGALPLNVHNAPMLLSEIEDQYRSWQQGRAPYVINLTLLPMSQEDIGFMDHHLGTGRVLILSRGYGNCRITNTLAPNTWRVVYYNSQDAVILNTVEIGPLPDVARAAQEDLEDSHERLREVLEWVEGGT